MTSAVPQERFWEVDVLRGVAIILMVLYHALFLLWFAYDWQLDVLGVGGRALARTASSTFLLLVGVSAYLSYQRASQRGFTTEQITRKFFIRGGKIFSLGLLVTLVSYLVVPESPIVFGILHCIGVSVALSPIVMQVPSKPLAILAGLIWVVGWELKERTWPMSELLFLGMMPDNFSSLDYFPLLPWFGLVLIGIVIGKQAYTNYKRQFSLQFSETVPGLKLLSAFGRRSLLIYMLHVPVLVALFEVALFFTRQFGSQ